MSTPYTLLFPTALDDADSLGIASNDAAGTLASPGLTIDGTSLTLTVLGDANEFGSSGALVIDDEIIYYTGKSGTTFSGLVRGQEGTSAAVHTAGTTVEQLITAASHTVLSAGLRAVETKLGYGAATPTVGKFLVGDTAAGSSLWRILAAGDIPDLSATYSVAGHNHAGVYAPVSHSHAISDTTGLQAALDGKQAAFTSQSANQVYAGPTSGGAASPAFRALVAADIPDLSGVYQPLDGDLTAIAALTTTSFGRSLLTEASAAALKVTLSLDNVENTALSTWAGSTNITTLGTVAAGVWQGTVIGSNYGGAGAASGVLKANGAGVVSASVAGTDYVAPGAVTTSGLTMATARLLGRSTASSGAIEEITIGSGLTLSGGELSASGGSGGITIGTTTITSGANTKVLFNNSGVVGEYAITGTGNVAMSASPTFTGTLTAATISPTAFVSTPISPSQLTADQNDYAGASGIINRLDSNSDARIISGMSPGTSGQIAVDLNIGSFDLLYTHQSGNSTATNRFITPGSQTLNIHPGEGVIRVYDGTTQRWRVLYNPYLLTPRVTTGSGTTNTFGDGAGVIVKADSLTSGNAMAISSSSVTSGSLLNIAATGTAAASNTKTALNVSTSGANATGSQTTYAIRAGNTSTGSGTNIAGYFTASGGTSNYAIQVAAGTIIGDTSSQSLELSSGNGSILSYGNTKFFAGGSANVQVGAVAIQQWGSNSANLGPSTVLSWAASGSAANSADTYLRRNGAANIGLGATAAAAAPVAQTLSAESVVGGTTNTAGATWKLIGSLGTSQGAPGVIELQTGALIAASGSTQQTAVSRLAVGPTKVLTNNTVTTLVNVTNASNTAAGGVIDYAVEVLDGTDVQYEVGSVSYMVTNKGGVWSGNTATKFGNAQNMTAGTLTVTWAISGANPALLSVNANSSLTPSTGYPRVTYNVRSLSQQAIAIQ